LKNTFLAEEIDSTIRVLLYILIFWLPYSPAVIEICVILSFVLWFVKRSFALRELNLSSCSFKDKLIAILKAYKPVSTFLNKPIAWFLLACFFSVIGSAFFMQSFLNFFTKTLEWFIIFFLVVEFIREEKHIKVLVIIFAITTLATLMDSYFQLVTHRDIFLGHPLMGGRVTAGFRAPNALGAYLTIWIPLLISCAFSKGLNKKLRIGMALVILISLCSLILTSSRGAWLATGFGCVFLLASIFCYQKKWKWQYLVATLLVITFICIISPFTLKATVHHSVIKRWETVQWRLSLWEESVQMVLNRPLFGHGINTYMQLFQHFRENFNNDPTYAHNCYIQLASEVGLIGFMCFMWIIFRLFHVSIKKINTSLQYDYNRIVISLGLISGIYAFLIHSYFDTNFYSLQLSAYLWFMIGILVVVSNLSNSPQTGMS